MERHFPSGRVQQIPLPCRPVAIMISTACGGGLGAVGGLVFRTGILEGAMEHEMNTGMRIEGDSMGEIAIPEWAYWGAQTQRAVENFRVSGRTLPRGFLDGVRSGTRQAGRCPARVNVRGRPARVTGPVPATPIRGPTPAG